MEWSRYYPSGHGSLGLSSVILSGGMAVDFCGCGGYEWKWMARLGSASPASKEFIRRIWPS
jgi:hypothetical protein